MSFYIDTSVIVATLVIEPHTPRAVAWLHSQAPGTVYISDWTHTEVASALSLKLRTGELNADQRATVRIAWEQLHTASLPTLAVSAAHFETARRFVGQHELGLRAGDALHLALAHVGGMSLATLDKRMADAALQLGVPVEPL